MENNDTPSEYITPFKFLIEHFEKRNLRTLSVNWERKNLFFHMYEKQVVMGCSFTVSEDDSRMEIHLRYPFLVANEKFRPAVAELVTRINYGLRIGAFEFDMKDGEVRYHIGHIMENESISEKTLIRLFNCGLETSDRYFPAFMQTIYSGVTPEDAVFMAELDMHSDRVEETIEQSPTPEPQTPAVEEKKVAKKRSSRKKKDVSETLLLPESSEKAPTDNTSEAIQQSQEEEHLDDGESNQQEAA